MKKVLIAIFTGVLSFMLLAGCSGSKDNSDLADKLESVKENTPAIDDSKDEEKPDKDESDEEKRDEEESKDNETDYEKIYTPVFDEVLEVLKNGLDYDKEYVYISDGLMERVMYPGEEDLLDDVGYILEDISGDGIPELVIGYNDSFDEDEIERSYVLGVFTLSDDEPYTVFSGWARNRYWPLPDGHFYNSGSGGASDTEFGENHLSKDGTEVIWDDFYFSQEDASGQIVFFHNTSGIWDRSESEKMDISERKFWRIMDEYEERCILFSWTPMRNCDSSGDSSLKGTDNVDFPARDLTNNMSSREMDKLQAELNSIGYYGFLRSYYVDPRDIEWNEVFYVGAGFDDYNGSLSEKINKLISEYEKKDRN